ncbi:MAG: EAL domain-containing protein [Candidatus Brocadiaceae bacterium]|nr:EAL domain-containing protein [Candidatus Brocadiaceae bacterium]
MDNQVLKVLFVDDDEDDYIIVKEMLSEVTIWKSNIDWRDTYDEALKAIDANQYDVCLFDYRLGQHNGLELFYEAQSRGYKTPVIIITGQDDYSVDRDAIKAGAADYLVKGKFDSLLLERSIRHAIYRKCADEAIKSAKDYAASFIKCSIDMIVAADLDYRITEFNPAAEKIFGYSKSEILGASMDILYTNPSECANVLRRLLKEKVFSGEIEKRKSNGETFPAFLTASILKDIHGNEIGIMGIVRDITERKRMMEQLKYNAFYDTLTGLPNRNYFMEHLEILINLSSKVKKYSFSVLFLDIDRFKVINDSLGHLAGDKLLISIAQRLKKCVRSTDMFARLGGDEFAVILEVVSDDYNAKVVAEKVLKNLREPFLLDEQRVVTSASIGIVLKGENYSSSESILRDADTVMYRAKLLGKARYAIFDVEMHAQAIKTLQLEADLRHAIERSELLIFYQPIVSLKNMHIVSFESLIRWQHPKRGLLPPNDFIPLAEETGLIDQIGNWVLEKSCYQNKAWHTMGFQDLSVSVNISALQLRHKKVPLLISDILKATRLPPRALELEITESSIMENTDLCREIFKELEEMNIQLLMDDFGTGFSSINNLKMYPFYTIKIDQSLIYDIDTNPDASKITRSIIDMAHSLKIKTTAEGVETKEQLELLKSYKCDYVQGYLLYKPMKMEMITELLKQKSNYSEKTVSFVSF